jgi:glycerol uptake facilitator-like aquaporin
MLACLKRWWFEGSEKYLQPNEQSQGTKVSIDKIFWFEAIGMFIFVFLQACTKQPTGIHLQITFILSMAIPMCAKVSGAHYNPAVTVSNYLCWFNKAKFSCYMMWLYFKAQIYAACVALALGYILNNGFLAGLAVPHDAVNPWRIIIS